MRFSIFTIFFFITGIILSQDFKINGRIIDQNGSALSSATVYLENPMDSSLVAYTLSNNKGEFNVEVSTGVEKLNFFISYAGLKPYQQLISSIDNDLGVIQMEEVKNILDEVNIVGRRAPISIKTDTLEFNAASFKTREDANLEDVLKELPGVIVDNNGNITVNGKPVSRILVNGKEFFGDDPKIATKNLPKEIIDKIQVVDTKTDSQEFTGEDGNSENKTINIIIEQDKNRGSFTRLTAGAGTEDRNELSGISNYFKDEFRMSILASSNNINSPGFTFDEVFDGMGRNAYSYSNSSDGNFSINGNNFGGGNGITKSDNLGFSLVNDWPNKTELSTNYFFNQSDNRNIIKIERENILPDRRFLVNSNSSSTKINKNHRFTFGFEIQPDSLTRISFKPRFNTSNGNSFNNSFTESTEEEGTLINNALTENTTEVDNKLFRNQVYLSRKFGNNGGFFNLWVENENNWTHEDNFFFSERQTFDENGDLEETFVQDQFLDENSKEDKYSINGMLRLPMTKKWSLDFELFYDKEKSRNERLVYNRDAEGNYENLEEGLSNDFRSNMYTLRPSVGVVFSDDTLKVDIAGGILHTRLQNENLFTNNKINNIYNNFFIDANLWYRITRSKSIYASIRNSRNMPQIRQLQPVTNTTNTLNIITGNPDLSPTLNTRLYVNFNNYNWQEKRGFYAHLGIDLQEDQIVSITTTGEDLVRTTTYTNVNGTYNVYGGLNLDKTFELDSLQTIKVTPGLYGNMFKRIGFSNGERFIVENLSLNPSVRIRYDWKNKVILEPSYSMGIIRANYSLNNRKEEFVNHQLSFQATSYWPKNFIIGSDMSYQKFGISSEGFDNAFLLWNASLGYKFFGDEGILKIKVFDILDENTSTSRYTGNDFVQNTEQLVLKQYFMLSFTYKFSKFAGKDPNDRK